MTPWSPDFLKPSNGSDLNLYWNPILGVEGTASAPMFPSGQNLSAWQGRGQAPVRVPVCGGTGVTVVVASAASTPPEWTHNKTDLRLYVTLEGGSYVLNIDCEGNWANCASGNPSSTNICLQPTPLWNPHPVPPAVDNEGWVWTPAGQLQAVYSKKCLEVCNASGAVAGCNGAAGSTVHLETCDDANSLQKWTLGPDGVATRVESKGAPGLFLTPPAVRASEHPDQHSIVADPLFVDPLNGDFTLRETSPAFALGIQRIPPIRVPQAQCGGSDGAACLKLVFAVGANY